MTTHPRITPVRVIALALVVVLGLALVAVRGGAEPDDDLVGVFADASPLDVGSEVRAAGVKVGSVSAIELDGKVAHVALDLDESIHPIHQDATMSIRPINLLGENFVELDPGSPESPELEGIVPIEQTGNAVTLQGLLDTFDDPTSTGLAALVSELGAGVDGSGAELGEAFKALAPAMQEIDDLGAVLRTQNDVLTRLIENADPVARAVSGEDGERLDRLVEQTTRTLLALSAQRTGIEQTLAELPSTLTEARQTLTSLDVVADAATPTLRRARPVTSDLEDIAGEISAFTIEATPAFGGFEGVFAQADALLEQAAPAVRALRQSGPGLVRTAQGVRPLGDEVIDQSLGDLMAFVRKWALSTNGRDAVSHYFRGVVHVSPEALNSLLGQDVIPPVVEPGGDGTGNSDPGDVLPDLPGVQLPDLPGVLGGITGGLNSATGLTAAQEQSLLGQLLGGQS